MPASVTGRTRNRYRKIKRAQKAKDVAELIGNVERQADPFERAKAFLQSRGYIVAPSTQSDGLWTIGARLCQTDRELVELAEKLGWSPKPMDLPGLNRRIGR